ncbi:BTB/POZ domain-containing protein 17-like isoform X2 [Acanthaster planci]|uniref:BTB/POZ domain-containing protein 17-like isoform X2 n=1 Tax=Acanthaster planci TaxID=133434 RepID=A0A8B7YLM1_ACAPL|nr:BTB/POZ domain-containing protein 17-like isoform X2 [Acanthaster planci]
MAFNQLFPYRAFMSPRRDWLDSDSEEDNLVEVLCRRQLLSHMLRNSLWPQTHEDSPQESSATDDDLSNQDTDLSQQLACYFNNTKFSDVKFKVGENIFHAHKVILCSWSDALREMFINCGRTSAPVRLGGHNEGASNDYLSEEITLEEPTQNTQVFADFLKFMYTETLDLTERNVYPLFELAKKYKVQDLSDVCQTFLMEKVSNDKDAALRMISKAEKIGMTELYEHCFSVLENNFEFLPRASLFNICPKLFLRLLGSSKLVVPSEAKVLACACAWLMNKENVEHRTYTQQVLSLIRFPHTSPSVLKETTSMLFQSSKIYPALKQALQRVLPGIYEWKVLAPDNVFSKLPYHVRFAAFSRHYTELRYYIGSRYLYNQLKLHAVHSKQHLRLGEGNGANAITVKVVGVSANNVCEEPREDTKNWSLQGVTFYDKNSEQWGIRYHLKPRYTLPIENAKGCLSS